MWLWSYTEEAHELARKNLAGKDHNWLIQTYAEWVANTTEGKFNRRQYEQASSEGRCLSQQELVETVWRWINNEKLCINGGSSLWVCPFGCHSVPISASLQVTR